MSTRLKNVRYEIDRLKVAIVHDWLTGMRGGERCLEVLCELFPYADVYTLLHVKGSVSTSIEKHPIRTSLIQRLPFSGSSYRHYLPLFPWAIQSLNLSGYDLVISSSHCVAKGVRVPGGTCHVAYVYTPMRYVWDQYDAYFGKGQAGWITRGGMSLCRTRLQRWDVSSNDRVHRFVAISQHVAQRIQRYWGQKATVVYPPLNWRTFEASDKNDGFYLMVTALVPYKRVNLAIQAVNHLGQKLKIIGDGPERKKLQRLAGPTVELLGWQPDQVVREYYMSCQALLFPGEEDFGIVPLEAMACGKPVVAFGRGGALETVVPLNPLEARGERQGASRSHVQSLEPEILSLESRRAKPQTPTGVFFYEHSVDALVEAIRLFERKRSSFDPAAIRAYAAPFDRAHFKEKMRAIIEGSYQQFRSTKPC